MRANAKIVVWAIARNLFPFVGMPLFGWSAQNILWLSAFNLVLQVVIITIASLVAPRLRNANAHQLIMESIWWGAVAVLIAATAAVVGVLHMNSGFLAEMIAHGVFASLAQSLWYWLLGLAIASLPAFLAEVRVEIKLSRTDAWIEQRSSPMTVFGEILPAAIAIGWCPLAIDSGDVGIAIAITAFTAFSLFRDIWPDQMRDMVRPSRRKPSA